MMNLVTREKNPGNEVFLVFNHNSSRFAIPENSGRYQGKP
jgi:hypothetical protein